MDICILNKVFHIRYCQTDHQVVHYNWNQENEAHEDKGLEAVIKIFGIQFSNHHGQHLVKFNCLGEAFYLNKIKSHRKTKDKTSIKKKQC